MLDKNEVQRQSIMFELIQAERNYVQDLEIVKEVLMHRIHEEYTVSWLSLGLCGSVDQHLSHVTAQTEGLHQGSVL